MSNAYDVFLKALTENGDFLNYSLYSSLSFKGIEVYFKDESKTEFCLDFCNSREFTLKVGVYISRSDRMENIPIEEFLALDIVPVGLKESIVFNLDLFT